MSSLVYDSTSDTIAVSQYNLGGRDRLVKNLKLFKLEQVLEHGLKANAAGLSVPDFVKTVDYEAHNIEEIKTMHISDSPSRSVFILDEWKYHVLQPEGDGDLRYVSSA